MGGRVSNAIDHGDVICGRVVRKPWIVKVAQAVLRGRLKPRNRDVISQRGNTRAHFRRFYDPLGGFADNESSTDRGGRNRPAYLPVLRDVGVNQRTCRGLSAR